MAASTSKVLFDVKLPATGRHYDFWVPRFMTMGEVAQLISEAMATIEPDFYMKSDHAALAYLRTGQLQDPSASVAEIGFSHGEQFMLL